MSTPQLKLSKEQIEHLHELLAQDDLVSALKALQQIAQHHGDKTLRDFVTSRRATLSRISKDYANEGDKRERNADLARLRETILQDVSNRENIAVEPPLALGAVDASATPSGRANYDAPSTSLGPKRSTLLSCSRISKRYRRGFRLPTVDFELLHGEIAGVVGFNGSGKTTLLRILAGNLSMTEGTIRIGDLDDRGNRIRNKVTFVPQDVPAWNGSLQCHLRQQAAFFGFDTVETNKDTVDSVVDLLGLEKFLPMQWSELSGGYRERAAIAAALVANPGLLVLDEPLAPLDPRSQQRLLEELHIRAKAAGTAIVISSQHIPEIECIADLMIVLGEASKVEIHRSHRDTSARGVLFEVGASPQSRERLRARLEQLKVQGDVQGYLFFMGGVAVRFSTTKTLTEATAVISGVELLSIRDISNSALARVYSELNEPEEAARDATQ